MWLHEVKARAKAAGSGSAGPTAPGATAAADTPHFPFSLKAPPFPQSPPVQAKPLPRHSPPLIFFSFAGERSALGANQPSRGNILPLETPRPRLAMRIKLRDQTQRPGVRPLATWPGSLTLRSHREAEPQVSLGSPAPAWVPALPSPHCFSSPLPTTLPSLAQGVPGSLGKRPGSSGSSQGWDAHCQESTQKPPVGF